MDSFDEIWQEWLKEENLEKRISEHLKYRTVFLPFMQKYLDKIPKGGKVLEIGAGTGIDSIWLAERYPHLSFVGSDLSKGSVELGKRLSKKMGVKVEFIVDDATTSKFKDKEFDLVFSQGVIEHFPDPSRIMGEQTRITKQGGYVIIDVPQKYNPYTIYKKRSIARGDWPYGWETAYSVGELIGLGRQHSLGALEAVGFNYGRGKDYYFFLIGEGGDELGKRIPPLKPVGDFYTKLIKQVEVRWGKHFLQNIAVSFIKI